MADRELNVLAGELGHPEVAVGPRELSEHVEVAEWQARLHRQVRRQLPHERGVRAQQGAPAASRARSGSASLMRRSEDGRDRLVEGTCICTYLGRMLFAVASIWAEPEEANQMITATRDQQHGRDGSARPPTKRRFGGRSALEANGFTSSGRGTRQRPGGSSWT